MYRTPLVRCSLLDISTRLEQCEQANSVTEQCHRTVQTDEHCRRTVPPNSANRRRVPPVPKKKKVGVGNIARRRQLSKDGIVRRWHRLGFVERSILEKTTRGACVIFLFCTVEYGRSSGTPGVYYIQQCRTSIKNASSTGLGRLVFTAK